MNVKVDQQIVKDLIRYV